MALVRLCRLENLVPLSQLAQWVAQESAIPSGRSKTVPSQPTASPALAPSLASASEKKKLTFNVPETSGTVTPESLDGIWQQVLSEVGFILASSLRKIQEVAIIAPNSLVLRIPAAYNSPGDPYLDANRLAKVEEALTKIVGQPCSLRLEVGGPQGKENGSPHEGAVPAPSGTAKRQRQRAEIAQVPLVGKAMDVLGGQIVQMDEEFGAGATALEVPQPGDATEEG
jgi:hypothetical protein